MLLTTTDQMKVHIGARFDRTMGFDGLRPYVANAQTNEVAPLLGPGLITALSSSSLTEPYRQVLHSAQAAIAWVAYQDAQVAYLYQFGNAGLTRFLGKDDEKLALWETDMVLADTARKADTALEQLMITLTQNNLPEWTSSTAYQNAHTLLINDVTQLGESLPEVSATWRMLAKLQSFMPLAERTYVRGVLGTDLFDELKWYISRAEPMGSVEKELWQHCRDLLAPATLWAALPSMQVRFFPDGVRIISSFKGLKDEKAASKEQIDELRAELWKRVESARGELKTFLNQAASATVFPDYFNSSLYVAPGPADWKMPDNEGKKHFRL